MRTDNNYGVKMESNIAVVKKNCYSYPKDTTFRPSKYYPEYLFGKENVSGHENLIYEMVREGFYLLK